jgi:hypothetical protein
MARTNPGRGVLIYLSAELIAKAEEILGTKNPKPQLKLLIQQHLKQVGMKLLDHVPTAMVAAIPALPPFFDENDELDKRVKQALAIKTQALSSAIPAPEPPAVDAKPKVPTIVVPNNAPLCYMLDKDLEANRTKAFEACLPHVEEFYYYSRMIRRGVDDVINFVTKISTNPDYVLTPGLETNYYHLIYGAYRVWWRAQFMKAVS